MYYWFEENPYRLAYSVKGFQAYPYSLSCISMGFHTFQEYPYKLISIMGFQAYPFRLTCIIMGFQAYPFSRAT